MRNKSEKKEFKYIKILAFFFIACIIGMFVYGLNILYSYSLVIEEQEEQIERDLLITCKAICPDRMIPYLRLESELFFDILRCVCYDPLINGYINPFKVNGG